MTVFAPTVAWVLARAVTHALVGLEPRKVEVEAHLQPGVPGFAIVGLADRACQEAKHRVRSGVVSAALEWPLNRRITVNLAPAALRKEGSGFDLPISLAVLAATRQLPPERLAEHAAVGELALDGRIRPVAGTLAVAEGARRRRARRASSARPSRRRRPRSPAIEPVPVRHLAEAVAYFRGEIDAPGVRAAVASDELDDAATPDLADVRGQERARRALEIAAAGGAQPAARGPARHGQDDARAPAAGDPAAADAGGGARGDAHPLGRRAAPAGRAARRRAAVPRAASRRVRAGDRRRRPEPAPGRGLARASRRAASRRAARSSRARCSRRCGSRSRTASSRSRASAGTRSFRRGSSSSGR